MKLFCGVDRIGFDRLSFSPSMSSSCPPQERTRNLAAVLTGVDASSASVAGERIFMLPPAPVENIECDASRSMRVTFFERELKKPRM
jgi:hypothetical protein